MRLAAAAGVVAFIDSVCYAKGEPDKPDTLVFTIKPRNGVGLTLHRMQMFRESAREVADATGCKIVVINGNEAECRVVGRKTFYSAKSRAKFRVRSKATGEEIRELIQWCETETGLIAYWPVPSRGPEHDGETLLMQIEGGLTVERIS